MPHFPSEEEEKPSPHRSIPIRSTTKPDTSLLPLSSPSLPATQDQDSTPSRIRIKNRRKRYLDLHPQYFTSSDLELADPILYDRLVRQHLSAQEREAQGRERGFTGVLEADLMRSEAKLNALAQKREEREGLELRRKLRGEESEDEENNEYSELGKDDAWLLWKDIMTQRFLAGKDADFEYGRLVDGNEELDDWEEEERERLEDWLEKEEEEEVFLPAVEGERRELKGETGVQDF
ncbi:hypothetical protein CERZMDRAFT_35625 [Cercospora zeae-maydis SCOH1-5]|uniref:CCD97-like C-terminal domain-containing protein n=1 Tax=Cercospora zeae-maydis SCOH1-5 TaxID=717836 RepID=A0A6A6FPE8_9PEZI|nr:hypothetical protein CERZMDRAFT_35625 [Cercospora zeae-maydis SCOH1-5]